MLKLQAGNSGGAKAPAGRFGPSAAISESVSEAQRSSSCSWDGPALDSAWLWIHFPLLPLSYTAGVEGHPAATLSLWRERWHRTSWGRFVAFRVWSPYGVVDRRWIVCRLMLLLRLSVGRLGHSTDDEAVSQVATDASCLG